MQDNKAIW